MILCICFIYSHFSFSEMQACVEEGKRRKVPVMAHAHGAEGIKLAALAGTLQYQIIYIG